MKGKSQRRCAIFAIGEACFLEIEIALDPTPRLVGDASVAQQRVDELALRRDQLPRQCRPRHGHVAGVGIELLRQLNAPDLMARSQQFHHIAGEFAVLDDGVAR